ncbi:unnamed protein product [Phytophthora fragariaefolia]|uniref:Unnamed protein product n=1 Tax=Phytophthora fragariaefolia TaxID=1490495 RepID=A0A9W6TNA0_9STRA|nr:unnamed protein product [Phytophthora fragariaefolia]
MGIRKCMTTLIDDEPVLPEQRFDISSSPLSRGPKYALNSGCSQARDMAGGPSTIQKKRRQVAVVHGAVNDSRTQILLHTGATVSMISLDLARRLKLKLNSHKQIKVSGLGCVLTYINASAQIKITLGHRVVYVMDLWVTNIGEDVDVLLGMDFMFSAGVRLCIREDLMVLPDEESILVYGDVLRKRQGVDLPITPSVGLHLRPGESATARIRSGQGNPLRDVVCAGRGDRWVTQIHNGAMSWATAAKVVNISDRDPEADSPRIKLTSHTDKRSREAGDTQNASSGNDCSSTTEAEIFSPGREQPEHERQVPRDRVEPEYERNAISSEADMKEPSSGTSNEEPESSSIPGPASAPLTPVARVMAS